jgi:hypothetical protein
MAAFPRKHEPDFRKSADESRPGSAARENAPRFERHNIRIARDRKQSGRRVSLTKRCDHGRTAARPAFRAFRMLSAACWALPRSHGAAIVAARDAAVAPTDEERGAATEAFLPGGQDRGGIAGRRVRHDRRRKACRSDFDLADRRRLPFHVCKNRSRARQTLAQVRWRTSSASA